MLHLTNGDSLNHTLQETDLPRTFIPWREALSTGPVHPEVGSPAFYEVRAQYLVEVYPEMDQSYEEYVVAQFTRLEEELKHTTEIILWFGADYFCQINLMAALSFLHTRKGKLPKFSLVCTDIHPETGNPLKCLGHLSPTQLAALFPQRTPLTQDDIALAHQLWISFATQQFTHFPLPNDPAFFTQTLTHLQQLNSPTPNGLNAIEQQLLELLAQHKTLSLHQWIGHYLRQDQTYGWGDTQIRLFIDRLVPLLTYTPPLKPNTSITLSPTGTQILAGKARRFPHLGIP